MTATTKKEYKEITPEFYSFTTEGDSIEGQLDKSETIEISGRPVDKVYLKMENGKIISFLANAQLMSMIAGMPTGTQVKITFDKMIKVKRGEMRTFRVFVQ